MSGQNQNFVVRHLSKGVLLGMDFPAGTKVVVDDISGTREVRVRITVPLAKPSNWRTRFWTWVMSLGFNRSAFR